MRALLVLSLLAILATVPTVASDGKALYDKKCAMCHGKDGVAKKMAEGSANLNDADWLDATSVEDIVKVTAEGKGKMKGFKDKMSEDELKLVAEYIKTLK